MLKSTILLTLVVPLFALAGDLEPSHKGGTLRLQYTEWPNSLNIMTGSESSANQIWELAKVTLMTQAPEDNRNLPYLAKSWKVSKDLKAVTFELEPSAKWQDGKPITTADIQFTFDLVYKTGMCTLCASKRTWLGEMESLEILGPHSFRFTFKEPHFRNLEKLGKFYIFPKHLYSKRNFEKDYRKVIYSGGPYLFDKKNFKFRKKIVLKRKKNHWSNKYPHFREKFNFDKIVFKFNKEEIVQYELFKRREIDTFYFNSSTFQNLKDRSKFPFNDKRLKVISGKRNYPQAWGGIALNLREGITKDLRVRKALQLMLDRKTIVSKIYDGQRTPVSGPFHPETPYSAGLKPVEQNLEDATKLLQEAGFKEAGDDGILYRMKDGKKERASLEILYSWEPNTRWLTMYQETAKNIGFEINLRHMGWSTLVKRFDNQNFESFIIFWTSDLKPFTDIFYGKKADQKGSTNYGGFKSQEIDQLIEAAPLIEDEKKRTAAFRKLEKKIVEQQPYVFLWMKTSHHIAYWSDKVDATSEPLKKFGGNTKRRPYFLHWRKAR